MNRRKVAGFATLFLLIFALSACGGAAAPAGSGAGSAAAKGPGAAAPTPPPASASSGSGAAEPTIRMGYCCITPLVMPYLYAQAKGIFKKNHVNVHIQRFLQGSATVAQAMAAGQIDIASEMGGPDNVLRLAERGGKIKMIATEEIIDPVWLYAKKGINRVSDLRGKTVVVGGLGGPLNTYGVLMVTSSGLSLKDMKVIQNGNNQQRFALLASGQADAATLSLPANFLAQQHGFHQLVFLGHLLKSAIEPWTVRDQTLKTDPVGVERFLKSVFEAQDQIKADPQGAAQLYAKIAKTSTATALKSIKVFEPYYGRCMSLQQMMYVFQFTKRAGNWKGPIPSTAKVKALMDDSVLKALGVC